MDLSFLDDEDYLQEVLSQVHPDVMNKAVADGVDAKQIALAALDHKGQLIAKATKAEWIERVLRMSNSELNKEANKLTAEFVAFNAKATKHIEGFPLKFHSEVQWMRERKEFIMKEGLRRKTEQLYINCVQRMSDCVLSKEVKALEAQTAQLFADNLNDVDDDNMRRKSKELNQKMDVVKAEQDIRAQVEV